jgi:hypothetical protein
LEGEYQKSLAALEGSFVSLNWVSAKNWAVGQKNGVAHKVV